ncbi:Clp protease N-terminal domain-containing protein [Streptomyces sp. NBC_00083]|uniref:Clp protease N-terminal domain-containing protein n=1 Tax=Streptomyces sp. NBC_00083 TaxID=2975647 RepID=UPI002254DFD9|nr:Clp protease N-terminal domain-containing protein [Streptomyces sp. NBC_00083]MCX5386887.1 peptidase [Streptomyces sp. NBC_00083]
MFEFFTERARRAIVASQDEAIALGHDFIGTEHILLGLAGTEDGTAGQVLAAQGVAVDRVRAETVRVLEAAGVPSTGGQPAKDALASIGIDVEEIKRQADNAFGPGAFQYPRPAYTPRAKKVLEATLREAEELGHDRFGTEHMLLGLLAAGDGGRGVEVLTALGADRARLRAAVLAAIAPPSA